MPEIKTISNQAGETAYNELKDNIKGSKLSIISAYFTMYAYDGLKKELDNINNLRFLFTTPSFSKNNKIESKEYIIQDKLNTKKDIFGNEYGIKIKK